MRRQYQAIHLISDTFRYICEEEVLSCTKCWVSNSYSHECVKTVFLLQPRKGFTESLVLKHSLTCYNLLLLNNKTKTNFILSLDSLTSVTRMVHLLVPEEGLVPAKKEREVNKMGHKVYQPRLRLKQVSVTKRQLQFITWLLEEYSVAII